MNFVTPTPIQAATIPVALAGRDVCGCAATGTGKTAAYMLPTLERLLYRPRDGVAVTRFDIKYMPYCLKFKNTKTNVKNILGF